MTQWPKPNVAVKCIDRFLLTLMVMAQDSSSYHLDVGNDDTLGLWTNHEKHAILLVLTSLPPKDQGL